MVSRTDDPGDPPDRASTAVDFDRVERYLAGDLSPSEHAAYTRWLEANPRHRRIVEAIAADYGRGSSAEPHWDVDAMRARAHFAMGARREVVRGVAASVIAPRPRSVARSRSLTLRAAGFGLTATVIAVAVLLSGRGGPRTPGQAPSPAGREYVTQAGEQLTVTLGDGTHLTLAPASRVRIPLDYATGDRTIALEGEAFATVTHDERHPFTIRVPGTVITDIGTAFDVAAYPGEGYVRIAVAAGRVGITATRAAKMARRTDHGRPAQDGDTGETRDVRAGDVAIVTGTAVAVIHGADIGALTSWTTGELRLTDVPVSDALVALNRWYNLKLRLGDPSLGAAHLTGRFRHEPLSQVLTGLGALLHARVVDRDGIVTLYPEPPRP